MVAVRAAALIALMLCACPEKIGVRDPDSGAADGALTDASSRDSGSQDARTEDATIEDARIGDATVEDGGEPEAPLRFGTMQLPDGQVTATTIWGRSPVEVYAGTANGNVLSFDPQAGWEVGWHEPSNFAIQRIRGTPDSIFVASDGSLHVHGPGLGDGVRSFSVGRQVRDLHVVSNDEAYLVADQQNGRGIYRFDGNGVDVLNDQLAVAVLYGVFVDLDGTVIVSGNGKIFRYQSLTWIEDRIVWPEGFGVADVANFDLYDVARAGADLFAVGDDHHVLRWEEGAAEWRFVYEPGSGEHLTAIGSLSAVEAYAVGRNGSGGPIARYAGGEWSHVEYLENHNFFDLFVADPDQIFAAGTIGSTLEPVILRGFR